MNLLAEKPNFIALKTHLLALTLQGCFFYAGLLLKDSAVIFERKKCILGEHHPRGGARFVHRNLRGTDSTGDAWCLGVSSGCALETKLHGLPWLNTAIPSQIAGGVRITARKVCIPQIGYARTIAIIPANIPTIDCTATAVSNTNSCSKATVPVIGYNVFATAANWRATGA